MINKIKMIIIGVVIVILSVLGITVAIQNKRIQNLT
jgi:hypothetical protein